MKLSDRTFDILKNLSTINTNIVFFPGSELKLQSPQKDIYVRAKIKEIIPKEFGIFDLPRFLGTYTMFDEPNITFSDKYLTLTEKDNSVKYHYASIEMLRGLSIDMLRKSVKIEDYKIFGSFTLSKTQLVQLIKASGVLQVPHIVMKNSDDKIDISTCNLDNITSDSFTLVKTGTTKEKFSCVIRSDILTKILPDDYEVSILNIGGYFKSQDIEYFVAANVK